MAELNLRPDLLFVLRSLRRRWLFSLTVIVVLALGTGGVVAMFSLVSTYLLTPPPYPVLDRLVRVDSRDDEAPDVEQGLSGPDYFDLAARSGSFERLGAAYEEPMTLSGRDELPRRVSHAAISLSALNVLGAKPLAGRLFTTAEESLGGPAVVLIGEELWRLRFAGDPAAVGRLLRLDGEDHRIAGVLSAGFDFPSPDTEIWSPLAITPETFHRRARFLETVGRLAPGVGLESAAAELAAIADALEAEYPETNEGRGLQVEPFLVGERRGLVLPLLVLQGCVLLLFSIACANAAGLLLARSMARRSEFAVRQALGAGRRRIVRLVLIESAVLASLATLLGIGLAALLLAAVPRLAVGQLPRLSALAGFDLRTVGVTLLVTLLCACLAGLVPALRAARADPARAFDGVRGGARRIDRSQRAFVIAELALVTVLMIAAIQLVGLFAGLVGVALGFEPERLLVAELRLPESRYPTSMADYPDWPNVVGFQHRLVEAVTALDGVTEVALAADHPLQEGWSLPFVLHGPDAPTPDAVKGEGVNYRLVSAGYWDAIDSAVLAGRPILSRDRSGAPPVALVSNAFAERHFGTASPLDHEIEVFGVRRRIVGVAEDVRARGLREEPPEAVYVPLDQSPSEGFNLLVRIDGDPAAYFEPVRRAVATLDSELAVSAVVTMEDVVSRASGKQRLQACLVAGFAVLALLMAGAGVGGTIAQSVRARRHEVGIRMALGAKPAAVWSEFVTDGMKLALAGAALGLMASFAVERLARSQVVVGAVESGGGGYLLSALIVLAAALAACAIPAWSAARADPSRVLRHG